jgi:hypothetical protein
MEDLLELRAVDSLATDEVSDGPPLFFAGQFRKRWEPVFVPTLYLLAQKKVSQTMARLM